MPVFCRELYTPKVTLHSDWAVSSTPLTKQSQISAAPIVIVTRRFRPEIAATTWSHLCFGIIHEGEGNSK